MSGASWELFWAIWAPGHWFWGILGHHRDILVPAQRFKPTYDCFFLQGLGPPRQSATKPALEQAQVVEKRLHMFEHMVSHAGISIYFLENMATFSQGRVARTQENHTCRDSGV